jgi:hypothetical protein
MQRGFGLMLDELVLGGRLINSLKGWVGVNRGKSLGVWTMRGIGDVCQVCKSC